MSPHLCRVSLIYSVTFYSFSAYKSCICLVRFTPNYFLIDHKLFVFFIWVFMHSSVVYRNKIGIFIFIFYLDVDWMFVPPPPMLKPNPQWYGIWKGPFGRWLSYKDGDFMNSGILLKRPQNAPLSLLPCEDTTKRWSSVNQEVSLHQTINLLGL